jgi:hypothetical protein
MAVKLYTPNANVIVHETKVDFRRRVVQRQVNLVQYDKSMPVIAVQLCSNGNEYVLPENASAYIRFGKRDHTYVYNECLGCDKTRTIVYFAITDQMTIFYGEHTPIVELRIGDTVAGSGSIPIWIDRNPIQNGDTESKSDLSVFEKAIEAAQKIDVKLPTDLKATATNLSLLAGSAKIGSGINLSGFEYDEATNTLKASGGGGGGSADTSVMTEKNVVIVEADATEYEPFIQQYHGIYGLYRITDCSITVTNDDRDDILFVGYPLIPRDTEGIGFLVGSIYLGTHVPYTLRSEFNYSFVGTGTYKFTNGVIDATPYGCVGNMTFGGLALLAGHETKSDEITTAIQNGYHSGVGYKVTLMTLKYDFKEKDDVPGPTKTFIGYVDNNTSNKLKLSGLFNGKQGTAVLEKDSSGAWVSNTPIEYAGAKETHHHTLTIKDGERIIFAANRELESATAATNLETLISTFAGTTTAGFGDYILLTVNTAAKLKKQDGTEVDLSTLNVTIEDIL